MIKMIKQKQRSLRITGKSLISAFTFCFLFLNSGSLYAADTTIKGTTSNNTTASLEVTNSSDTSLMFVRNDGNVGIGDTTPASALTVGAGDLFQVNSSGDVIKLKNVDYVWPAAQGANSTVLTNNGSGGLAWSAVGTGSAALSGITAAAGANTTANGDYAQVWNWALTTADKTGFNFGETSASTATGTPAILKASTLAASTAIPLYLSNLGAGLSFRVDDQASDTSPFVIDAAGNVGIGTTTPTATLQVVGSEAIGTGITVGENTTVSSNILGEFYKSWSSVGNAYGVYGKRYSWTGTNTGTLYGVSGQVQVSNTSSLTNAIGVYGYVTQTSSGTLTNAYSIYAESPTVTTGTLTNAYNIYAHGTANNYFGGNVGIGTTAPGAKLEIYRSSLGVSNTALLLNTGSEDFYNYDLIRWYNQNGYQKAALGAAFDGDLQKGLLVFQTATGGALTEKMRINNLGNVGIGTTSPTSKLQVVGLPIYANNAAAVAGGLTAGAFYRTGGDPDPVYVVH